MVIKYNGYFYVNEKSKSDRAERILLKYFNIKKDITMNLVSLGEKEISKENNRAFNQNSVTDVIQLINTILDL